MCCFSRPVKHVSSTHIFARLDPPEERQTLIYSMSLEIEEELAMVLPIPVKVGVGEDAVRFVDLSAYPKIFTDMRRAFPEILSYPKRGGMGRLMPQSASRQKLEVHDVGDFVASFVPSARDFDRLDARFRLSPTVFEEQGEYGDYGFAVFQLKPRKKGWFFSRLVKQTIHPMAFTFPTRRPRSLFFPTLHVHDGGHVPERAVFDHSLYCQSDDELLVATFPFDRSTSVLGESVNVERAGGLLDGRASGFRHVVMGELPNEDLWYDPPHCAGAHVLREKAELFAFELRARSAFYTHGLDETTKRWQHVARTSLDKVHSALDEGLRELTANRRQEWGLLPLEATPARARLSGDRIIREPVVDSFEAVTPGTLEPLRVRMWSRTKALEPQEIELCLRVVPSPERIREILSAIDQILDRALGDAHGRG